MVTTSRSQASCRSEPLNYLCTENLKDEDTITPVTDRDQRKFRSYLYNRKLLLRKKTSDPETHEIFCTQCPSSSLHGYWKTPASRTTSSHLLVHFRSKHPDLPTNDTEEEKICLRLGLPKNRINDDESGLEQTNLIKPRKSDEAFVPETFQMLLVKAILTTNIPVEIVETQEFQDLLLYLNPEAPIPSRADVHGNIAKLLKNEEKTDHVRWPDAEVLWGCLTDLIEAEKSTVSYIVAIVRSARMGKAIGFGKVEVTIPVHQ